MTLLNHLPPAIPALVLQSASLSAMNPGRTHVLLLRSLFPALIAVLLALPLTNPASAQPSAPCGVVDAIDYPIPIDDTLSRGYDDFGILRPRFGGNHVGIDIGFDRWGDPVHAAARGRVTLANLTEWDTEKGVVILEHTFPDGSIAYTLYGHVEQGDGGMFPLVGSCVERGDVIALIGWPSRGKPHLHYEIRSMLPGEGGPGYVDGNPLEDGWYHPLEFTELWRTRLQPGFLDVRTYLAAPTLPPASLEDGSSVLAISDQVVSYSGGVEQWRISLGEIATGLTALPGNRVAVVARGGQIFTLQNGRFLGAWSADVLEASPVLTSGPSGEALVFPTAGGGLAAWTLAGQPLWTVPPLADSDAISRVLAFEGHNSDIDLVVRTDSGPILRAVRDGALAFDRPLADPALVTAYPGGGFIALDGPNLIRLQGDENHTLATLDRAPARASRLAVDSMGRAWLYDATTPLTLTAFDADGLVRWNIEVPEGRPGLSPLLAVGGGCLLYTLDADGALRAYQTEDGTLAAERLLFPGGNQSGSPRARLLTASPTDELTVSAGFLSVLRLDGLALPGDEPLSCAAG